MRHFPEFGEICVCAASTYGQTVCQRPYNQQVNRSTINESNIKELEINTNYRAAQFHRHIVVIAWMLSYSYLFPVNITTIESSRTSTSF